MELDPLRHVKFFAVAKHAGQNYGVLPYSHHLFHVEMVLRRFGRTNHTILQAAWLHDIVEDTPTKLKEITEMFGEEVSHLVGCVTDEPGPDRKARKYLTYPKIRAGGPDAIALKLADRIANVESGGSLVDKYKKEYEDFRRSLWTQDNPDMWGHLDNLMDYKV